MADSSSAPKDPNSGSQPVDQQADKAATSSGAALSSDPPASGQAPPTSHPDPSTHTEAPPSALADADKEKASLSTSPTASAATHAGSGGARRQANKSGASDATAAANGTQTAGGAPRAKKGLIARLKGALLSCVAPSQQPVADDVLPAKKAAEPSTAPTADGKVKAEEEAAEKPATAAPVVTTPTGESQIHGPDSLDAAAEVVTSDTPSTPVLPPAALSVTPPSPTGAEIVVPPTPTKVLPVDETGGMTSGAVQPPGSTGEISREASGHEHRPTGESDNESQATSYSEEDEQDSQPIDDVEDDEDRLIMNGGAGIPIGPDGVPRPLLPPISPQHAGRKCLVLDLDETLVHSSFKSISQADYVVPVEIEYHWHNVYVIKRPGVDNFLKKMGEIYEVVVFTASLSKYADPVLDKLDIHRVVSHRLFRESCYNHKGTYVKDLSQLGRPIEDTIILDNSPASYIFHPNNAVPVSSWFNDPHDTELTDLCPFLADLAGVDDVRGVLDGGL